MSPWSPLLQVSSGHTAPISGSLGVRCRPSPRASASPNHIPHANGRNRQPAAPSAERYQPAAASNIAARSQPYPGTKKSESGPTSWSQRMANIQELMHKAQEQLQQHAELQAHNPDLANKLKCKAEQHLELLMQLAEAEQKHIVGDMPPEQLHQVLQDLHQQLDGEQEEALAALQQQHSSTAKRSEGSNSSSNSVHSSDTLHVQKHKQLLGATVDLKEAIDRASAGLAHQEQELQVLSAQLAQQSNASDSSNSATSLDQKVLAETQSRIEAAEAAISNTQQLLLDYDQMCQRAFQLSRKLSLSEAELVEVKGQLAHARAELAGAADELAEHRELQMQFDMQCQDMYKLRMMLQQAQAAGTEVAAQAAGTSKKFKQDISWLMEAHRREMAEAQRKNQELAEDTQELRMRLLELEQQLWSQSTAAGTPKPLEPTEPATASEPVLLQQQQPPEELAILQDAVQRLTQEKQQLMKNLQDMQREQAVLLMELQSLQEQQKQKQEASAEAVGGDTVAVEAASAAAKAAGVALQQQLDQLFEQRDVLMQQVRELQQSLQEYRAAAAARGQQSTAEAELAPSSSADTDPAAVVAAEQELSEVKAQMVQLRGQLAVTRRELAQVTGRVTAAEAALQQQAANYETQLQQLQTLYSRQTAVVAQLRKGKMPAAVGFKNTNRFWVRHDHLFEFLKHWVVREGLLQQQAGFLGLLVEHVPGVSGDGGVDVIVSSLWESIPHWETWSKSDAARQQHMPVSVYQYVPKKGEGFPEDFVPFRDYDDAVNAKY